MIYLEEHFTDLPQLTGWVNGNLYAQTTEVVGVLPVPPNIREISGMASFEPTIDFRQPHGHLASLQGTRKPILPVHSLQERQFFRALLNENKAFNSPNGPDFKQAVRAWNHEADKTPSIFYKVRIKILKHLLIDSHNFSASRTSISSLFSMES